MSVTASMMSSFAVFSAHPRASGGPELQTVVLGPRLRGDERICLCGEACEPVELGLGELAVVGDDDEMVLDQAEDLHREPEPLACIGVAGRGVAPSGDRESSEKCARENSHTVATVNGSEPGKSAPSAVHPTPQRERHGDPVTATGMSGDFAPCANAAASGRWSMRSFGEYALLEDSRYASQAENARVPQLRFFQRAMAFPRNPRASSVHPRTALMRSR